jgi:hypothetical protein
MLGLRSCILPAQVWNDGSDTFEKLKIQKQKLLTQRTLRSAKCAEKALVRDVRQAVFLHPHPSRRKERDEWGTRLALFFPPEPPKCGGADGAPFVSLLSL